MFMIKLKETHTLMHTLNCSNNRGASREEMGAGRDFLAVKEIVHCELSCAYTLTPKCSYRHSVFGPC